MCVAKASSYQNGAPQTDVLYSDPHAACVSTKSTCGTTQATFNAGVYVAPEIGVTWWDNGDVKSVMLSVGIMAGYINTDATGAAFVLGVQLGLIAKF